jgi:hypothetical protein
MEVPMCVCVCARVSAQVAHTGGKFYDLSVGDCAPDFTYVRLHGMAK